MWVAGIERLDNKLGLIFQDADGRCRFGAPEDLRSELPLVSSGRREVRIDFSKATIFDTGSYLKAVGLSHLCDEGQRCYEFTTSGGTLVIPGQLVVVALVGVTSLMRAPLLTPHGPTSLMTAFSDDCGMHVELTPRRMRTFQLDRTCAVSRMEWILSHLSGRRAWSSVYFHAMSKRLDITLPAAKSSVAIRGVNAAGKIWVTSFELLTLEPLESPHEFVGQWEKSQQGWQFTQSSSLAKLENDVKAANLFAPLTDEQWTTLKILLGRHRNWMERKQRDYNVRSRLDAIRLHLYSGLSFYQLPISRGLRESSRGLAKRLKRENSWSEVARALRSTI